MNRFFRKISWILIAAGIGVFADGGALRAENTVIRQASLESLIEEAMRKNPGLEAKKKDYEAKKAKVIGAWLPEDPTFGVDVEGQPNIFDFDERSNNEYMVEQMIPFPTKLFLRGLVAAKEADMAYENYKEEERDLIWHIEQPFYELFVTRKTKEALSESQKLLDQLLQTVKARYESNQSSQADVLKTQIELSKISIELFDLDQGIHLKEAHFSHTLNESLATSYEVLDEKTRPTLSLSLPELEKEALEKRPELQSFQVAIDRAKASRALAQTEWLPDITARYEKRDFRDSEMPDEHDTFIGVTVPVFSLLKGIGGTWKSAGDEVAAAEALYTKMKNETLLSVHEAYSKVRSAENALEIYEQSILPQARQQVELALASYEAGKSDFLNLIDAHRTLRDTEIDYYKHVAEFGMGVSDLELAVGAPVVHGTHPTAERSQS